MRPELEIISFEGGSRSLNYFEVEQARFQPYWHHHAELELTWITKGRGTRFVGNSVQYFDRGDLVLLGEYLPHSWVSSQESEHSHAVVIQFPKSLFEPFVECAKFKYFFDACRKGFYFTKPNETTLGLIKSLGKCSPIHQLSQMMLLLDALCEDESKIPLTNLKHTQPRDSYKVKSKIAVTIDYTIENLSKKISISDLASLNHMVPQSFCRWFRKWLGVSFVTFLNSSRVESACQGLIHSDKSIQEIAFGNGFESISHFNRVFKKIKGVSPSIYRKSQL